MDGMHEGYQTDDWANGWECPPPETSKPLTDPWDDSFLPLTHHARKRMQQRRIDFSMVELVIQFGREVCTRGALVFAIGRNEIAAAAKRGHALQQLEGIHVVTSHDDGAVLTVYRNRDLSNLKSNLGHGKRWRQKKWGKNCPSLS
jgi:hypothetical protein